LIAAPESKVVTGYLYEEEPVRAVRPRPKARKNRGSLVVMVMVIFLTGMAVAYYYAQLYTLDYQLNTLQNQINTLEASTQDLNASVSTFSSLSYVEEVATTKLGMVKASGQPVLTVSVAPPVAAPIVQATTQPSKQVYAVKNPVIEAFNQMVSRFEQKIKNG